MGLAAFGGSGGGMGVVESYGGIFIWFAMALLLLFAWHRSRSGRRRRRGSVGPAAAGAFYEMLGDDRRKAIEIVLEEKAAYHDPEDADGSLPELDDARGLRTPQKGDRVLRDRRRLAEDG